MTDQVTDFERALRLAEELGANGVNDLLWMLDDQRADGIPSSLIMMGDRFAIVRVLKESELTTSELAELDSEDNE